MNKHQQTIAAIQQRAKSGDSTPDELIADLCDIVATLEAKLDDTSRRLATATKIKRKHRPPRRYVVVGEWSGNRPSQKRVCHMHVVPEIHYEKYRDLTSISFADGTILTLKMRRARVGERVKEKHAFKAEIDAAIRMRLRGDVSMADIDLKSPWLKTDGKVDVRLERWFDMKNQKMEEG